MAAGNGFKIVEFSPELKNAVSRLGETRNRLNDYAWEMYRELSPQERLDPRDLVEMMSVDVTKSEEENKEYARGFVKDYLSGDPELRKQCLDNFYNQDDSFDPSRLDLSCLKGTDTGTREPGGLTNSEKDFLVFADAFRREQAISQKLRENPEYAQQRYGEFNPREKAEFEARRTVMMNGLVSYADNVMRSNGLNQQLMRTNPGPLAGDGECVAADLSMELYNSTKDRFANQAGDSSLKFALGPQNGNIYGLTKQLASGNLTREMRNNAVTAYEASVETLYRSALPRETMNELGTDPLDLIHVDGLPARERYGNKYGNLSEWDRDRMIKAEVMGALAGGQRVDAVTMEMGPRGRMQAVAHPLEVDLHAYDQMEKRNEHNSLRRFFDRGPAKIKTGADNVDRKNQDDRDRGSRTSQISESFASRLEALESKKLLMDDLGISQKPVTPEIQRQEEKLKGIEGKIGEIEKQNFSSYKEIGSINRELERRKAYEEASQRVHKALGQIETSKAVKDDGNLMEVHIREAMELVTPDYKEGHRKQIEESYQYDFLPGYFKIDELRSARDLSPEQLEARRDRLQDLAAQGEPKQQYRLEAVNALLNADTPQEREQVMQDTLEGFKTGAREHLLVCLTNLSRHPTANMTPEEIESKEKRVQTLEEGLVQVPRELLEERAQEEARLNYLKEKNGDDRRPQIKKFGQAERLHPDYVPPSTKEEALARIGELDAKYGSEIQYLDRREMAKNFRAQGLSTIDETKPHWAKEQAAMTLQYMDRLPIDTSGLDDRHKQMLAEGRNAMEQIAAAKAGTISLSGCNAKGIGIGDAYAEALLTDPACAKAAAKGVKYAEGFSQQWELRQLLMDDLKELVKKDPVKDVAAEKGKTEPEKAAAEKAKNEPEKAAAEKGKAEPEKAAAEKGKTEPEKAAAEKGKTEPEKAVAEKGKTEPEKAAAEKAKTEPEKAAAEKGKTEPEKAAAEKGKTEPEKAAAEKGKTEPEKAAAEKAKTEPEKAAAEKGKTEPEKAAAEKAKAESEKKGKKEVTFETLELTEKEAKEMKKPESTWERRDKGPFHREETRAFKNGQGIGSHRPNNKKPAK